MLKIFRTQSKHVLERISNFHDNFFLHRMKINVDKEKENNGKIKLAIIRNSTIHEKKIEKWDKSSKSYFFSFQEKLKLKIYH